MAKRWSRANTRSWKLFAHGYDDLNALRKAWASIVDRIHKAKDQRRFASLFDEQGQAAVYFDGTVAIVARVEDVSDLRMRLQDALNGRDPLKTMASLATQEMGRAVGFALWPRSSMLELEGCIHPSGAVVMERHRIANGTFQVRERCTTCQENPRGVGVNIPHSQVPDMDSLPLASDATIDGARVCNVAGCGRIEVEDHHFAPRFLFGEEEAEKWPVVPLCRQHHAEWHATVTPAGLHRPRLEATA